MAARLLATAAIAALAFGGRPCYAQTHCGFDRLVNTESILATCCESTKARDCGKGFPPKCTLQCAKLLVPFYNSCAATLKTMPKGHFKFPIRALKSMVQNCEHTQELFTHSIVAGQCATNAKEKEKRILDVTEACCTQGGKFVCKNGMPWKCNAQCATAYVPFFDQCIKQDTAISVKGLQKYNQLYENCANMGSKEVVFLLSEINVLIKNPKCVVNTTGIKTRGPKVGFLVCILYTSTPFPFPLSPSLLPLPLFTVSCVSFKIYPPLVSLARAGI